MKVEFSDLKRQSTRLLAALKESGREILITDHGKPSAYLVDFESYEAVQSKVRILEGIVRGESALLENGTFTEPEAKDTMAKWLG